MTCIQRYKHSASDTATANMISEVSKRISTAKRESDILRMFGTPSRCQRIRKTRRARKTREKDCKLISCVGEALKYGRKREQVQNNNGELMGWRSLNHDVQHNILERLPLQDLENARLAGLDAESPRFQQDSKQLMRTRCLELQPLWKEWRNTSRLKSREYRHNCDPVEFSKVKKLSACHCLVSGLKHLWHLKDLQSLHITACPLFHPQLDDLNRALRSCTGLLELSLASCTYDTFPESILKLKKLRRLDLSRTLIKRLPENMGDELPELRFVKLADCLCVQRIPESLLCLLEWRKRKASLGKSKTIISINLNGFSPDRKKLLVPAFKYPLLAKSI